MLQFPSAVVVLEWKKNLSAKKHQTSQGMTGALGMGHPFFFGSSSHPAFPQALRCLAVCPPSRGTLRVKLQKFCRFGKIGEFAGDRLFLGGLDPFQISRGYISLNMESWNTWFFDGMYGACLFFFERQD